MADTLKEMLDVPQNFVKEGTHVRRCRGRLALWLGAGRHVR
jgi:hypothetical protein